MTKIRLILADDHPLIREGFKSLLGKNDDFEIIAVASNGSELLQAVEREVPDIILTDITMAGVNGLQAIDQLVKRNMPIKFIVLTMHDEPEYVLNAIKIGVHGYLLKDIERADLEKAISTVYNGGKYFSPIVTSIMAESLQRTDDDPVEEITPREREVLKLVAEGHSTKQIADKLNISIRTVESHRINMLKKMRVSNSAELIKKAIQLNVI